MSEKPTKRIDRESLENKIFEKLGYEKNEEYDPRLERTKE